MVKHAFMTQLWRFQQSQAILGLFLWGALLTLSAYPVASPVILGFLKNQLDIPATAPGAVFVALLILFAIIFAALSGFGLIYDRYLQLWRAQSDVAVDRNPYTRERLTAKEILTWRHMFLPVLQAGTKGGSSGTPRPVDPAIDAHIAFMESWIRKSLEDTRTSRAVEETRSWIEPRR